MDLAKIKAKDKADAGAWLTLKFVDGTVLDAQMKLTGSDSKRYRDKQKEISLRRIEAMKRNSSTLTPDEIESQGTELLTACVLEWKAFESDGKPYEFNTKNVETVLRENPWIKEQVDTFVGDRRNFLEL